MQDRTGVKWSREETILAFELYCQTPFGKIGKSNPSIVALSRLLGRTPDAVALKMHNLAHNDPELKKRNVIAMAHGSKLDAEIFKEFSSDWETLSYQAKVIKASMQNKNVETILEQEDIGLVELWPEGEDHEGMVKQRVGQYFFRAAVLNSYNNRCCVTGLKEKDLLIASHIKPWAACDEKTERTNPSNGLCLNALHDRAFDKGFITIDNNYSIVISKRIIDTDMDDLTREWFMSYGGKQINMPDKFLPEKRFIEYHQDVIYLR